MLETLQRTSHALARQIAPLRWVLLVATVLHAVGLFWGLPASDTWDVDGVAPRDFWPGLIETFTPGHYYTYPPFHLAVLAILSLPIAAIGVARAPSFSAHDVVSELIHVPYMTGFAVIARVVTLLMSLGVIVALAKTAEELAGGRAGRSTAWFATLGVPFTYYAHTSNLDVPYLFWALFATLALVRSITRHEPRRLRKVAVLAALAVATKDQAFAMFVPMIPLAGVAWLALDPWPRSKENGRLVARELAIAGVLGAAIVLVLDGAVTNPSGFRARLAFLTGPASQDFAQYATDAGARWTMTLDITRAFTRNYPLIFAVAVAVGLVWAIRRGSGVGAPEHVHAASIAARRAASLVPLLGAVSFTVAFDFAARRVEERFTLPQMMLVSVYGGIGADALSRFVAGRWGVIAAAAWALFRCARVDATMLLEPRYDTEHFLAGHVHAGDTIEVHGLNVYLPRFPVNAHVERVGRGDVLTRNPLPDVVEKKDTLGNIEARRPRWIVVSECYAWRYLYPFELTEPRDSAAQGRIAPPTQVRTAADQDATTFFRSLLAEQLPHYRRAHESRIESAVWSRVEMHASLGCPTWTFERTD